MNEIRIHDGKHTQAEFEAVRQELLTELVSQADRIAGGGSFDAPAFKAILLASPFPELASGPGVDWSSEVAAAASLEYIDESLQACGQLAGLYPDGIINLDDTEPA